MHDAKKIEYYDLKEEALAGTLPELIGRSAEIERLTRVIMRRVNNNILLVGPNGIGKTTLVYGLARHANRDARNKYAFVQFDVEHLYALEDDPNFESFYADALRTLPPCIVFIDDFGREAYKNADLMLRLSRLYKSILKKPNVRLILAMEPHEHAWLEREYSAFAHMFEAMHLKTRSAFEHTRVLRKMLPRINEKHRVIVPDDALQDVVSYAERFSSLGQLPQSAIQLLDESLSHSASCEQEVLTQDSIAHVVEVKTGIPKARLTQDELKSIKKLADNLNARIVDQTGAIANIATTLKRAKLGLRNPQRPLGSFLLLGPSGVGKTETAKCVAELLFGRAENLLRFDMSEFQQDHTVQRLIGAPAGYIGYEEGGALTNALGKEPHSLILLDEIEKAHPKVFDIFLQVLDEGRLTSGQNETVDARNAIVMATSNAAVAEILAAYSANPDIKENILIQEKILPVLSKTFRLEFINRFDSILVFKPLSLPSLLRIARLEIEKIEKRFEKYRVRFEVEPKTLRGRIEHMVDPRFGARPVKRFIEETCETLLAESLLQRVA